jgi:hypothetical protein
MLKYGLILKTVEWWLPGVDGRERQGAVFPGHRASVLHERVLQTVEQQYEHH